MAIKLSRTFLLRKLHQITGIVPHPSVMDEERNNQLAVIELAEKDWIRPVGVIYRTDRTLSIAAKKFVQLLENKPQKS